MREYKCSSVLVCYVIGYVICVYICDGSGMYVCVCGWFIVLHELVYFFLNSFLFFF